MKQYIIAEFELYKKNKVNIIIGFCGLFLYAMFLLFSGIGGMYYSATISIIGYMDVLFFLIPLYLSPASYWRNRQKVCIPSEQLLLTLGESKRTYIKIRILAFTVLYFSMLCLTAFMQIPAYLIAGEQYSLLYFGTEAAVVTAFTFFTLPVLFFVPHRFLTVGIPLWAGFCGGFAGGYLGEVSDFVDKREIIWQLIVIVAVTVTIGMVSMGYGYLKAIRDERGGYRKPKAGEREV